MNLASLILGSPHSAERPPPRPGLAERLVGLTWAWSIVTLTVIVRTIVPLTAPDPRAGAATPRAADEGDQKKYKADKQKQNEER
jgi:hypothetical protein